MRVAVWGPLPPDPSGIADYSAELLPGLGCRLSVVAVVERPEATDRSALLGIPVIGAAPRPEADLDLYQIGNSPAHVGAYRAALERPGVVVLHEWNIHDLVYREHVERGDEAGYRRGLRAGHGEMGAFVGRQVCRGTGGRVFPALLPANSRLLDSSLAVVAVAGSTARLAAEHRPNLPVLHLPQHATVGLRPVPTREAARHALGLAQGALLVTAAGVASEAKGLFELIQAVTRLRSSHPHLRLVVAGKVDPGLPLERWVREAGLGSGILVTGRLSSDDLVRHLAAADVVSALRFPSRGEVSAILMRALAVGRACLVTAGTPAAQEFPDGVVIPVDPWPSGQLEAVLERVLAQPGLCAAIGERAREHVDRHHSVDGSVARLTSFLSLVLERKAELISEVEACRVDEAAPFGYLWSDVMRACRALGSTPPGLRPLVTDLLGGPS